MIISLESAIKELIENSIDAGATTIDIRFHDHGLGGVEVRDNGHGIDAKDFEALAQRSATSKIREFEDVEKVASYGFRGEALSSLAAVAELSVTTSTEPPMGYKLEYGPQGNLTSKTPLARDRGTTVSFRELFKPFPVRLAEFRKNVKREYAKAVASIQAYGIVRTDVRFMCSNQTGKERAVPIFSTQVSRSMKDNIAAVFGAGVVDKLVAADSSLNDQGASIAGFVSKVTAGSGRASADRVFFWVNKRPCELPKFTRAINESYRLFNQQSYPMIFLDVSLSPDSYDVNVSPDKRTILLHDEAPLLESLRTAMANVFEKSGTEYQSTQAPPSAGPAASGRLSFSTEPPRLASGSPRSASSKTTPPSGPRTGMGSRVSTPTKPRVRDRTLEEQPVEGLAGREVLIVDADNVEVTTERLSQPGPAGDLSTRQSSSSSAMPKRKRATEDDGLANGRSSPASAGYVTTLSIPPTLHLQNTAVQVKTSLDRIRKAKQSQQAHRTSNPVENEGILQKSEITADQATSEAILTKHISKDDFALMEVIGQFNLGFIIVKLRKDHPLDSDPPTIDLFIVDQHASDEKFNYEQLGADLVPNVQMMLAPQLLSLSSTEQLVVGQHMDILQRNGFQIGYEESAQPSQRYSLRGVPNFGGIILGLNDLEDLIGKLSDSAGGVARPTKIERILASKACRKSVMIGDPLPRSAMEKIVRNMGRMQLPWNCPHGRPTMRHLCSLSLD